MEILAYYILFISAVIIIASCVNVEEPNKKLLDNIDNLEKDKKEYEPMNNGSKYYKL
jgi:hypothetical protein